MLNHSPVFKSSKSEAIVLNAYDAAMKLWPISYEEHDVDTQFGSTHVIVSGPSDAPPLVMLHCALMTSAIWSPIIADLSRDYRTYAVDVMGDVGKSVPTNPPKTYKEFAQWLVEVYDNLGIDTACILGWSFGGFIATNFAIHEPQRVEKLALLAPYLTFVNPGPGFLLGFLPFLIPTRSATRIFERAMCYKRSFGPAEHSELLYQRYKNCRLVLKVAPRKFKEDELKSLKMPVLLLIGDKELLYNPRSAVNYAKRALPNVDAELVPNCNHAVVSDQTALVSNRVLDFLKS
ncbi:MAG: alpha/beta hydrolase [Candidatus Aminicenantes bacterium]|jgi:pimeloyl-ACP methyl ester carboxylesterase